ncbi:MAG: hypothetical protein HZB31_15465 [Nitrospirae bacterium]|nr:hypothetical protein [Nitrospirota bacterium]
MARLYILQLLAGIAGGFMAANKGRSIPFWFMVCLILPLLTIIIFILPSLKADTAGRRCPNCSHPLRKHEDRCSHCGWQKPIELVQCSSCGSFVSGQENCPACSRKR